MRRTRRPGGYLKTSDLLRQFLRPSTTWSSGLTPRMKICLGQTTYFIPWQISVLRSLTLGSFPLLNERRREPERAEDEAVVGKKRDDLGDLDVTSLGGPAEYVFCISVVLTVLDRAQAHNDPELVNLRLIFDLNVVEASDHEPLLQTNQAY